MFDGPWTFNLDARLRKASIDEKLFALVQTQLEFLAPHERFIGAAFGCSRSVGTSR